LSEGDEMPLPFVSCVMPTCNRPAFVRAAIDCFLKQTYQRRELVILDDGHQPLENCPNDTRVRYIRAKHEESLTLGMKRNRINEMTKGEIICHWDDDDWSAPGRLVDQVARMARKAKRATGYSSLLFWDVVAQKAKLFVSAVDNYACGTTLCYYREFWLKNPFPDLQMSSDNEVVYPNVNNIAGSNETRFMVARIHGAHTSTKSNIDTIVPKERIPAEFWDNERRRLDGNWELQN
jgi:glycosyltransferase involved in cell wall biosynthesis